MCACVNLFFSSFEKCGGSSSSDNVDGGSGVGSPAYVHGGKL